MESNISVEKTPRRAPVQGQYIGLGHKIPPGTISWGEHEEAMAEYNKHHAQDSETLARRGGFGYTELVLYLGHAPKTWEIR